MPINLNEPTLNDISFQDSTIVGFGFSNSQPGNGGFINNGSGTRRAGIVGIDKYSDAYGIAKNFFPLTGFPNLDFLGLDGSETDAIRISNGTLEVTPLGDVPQIACAGDSGGPLIHPVSGVDTIVGVSYGVNTLVCINTVRAFYTSTSSIQVRDWLQESILSILPLPPPSNLSATVDATSQKITLSWQNNGANQEGTSILRKELIPNDENEGDDGFQILPTVTRKTDGSLITTYEDPDSRFLFDGKTYIYKLKASNKFGGFSASSSELSVFVPKIVQPPTQLTFSILAAPQGAVKLTWVQTSAFGDRFKIERKLADNSGNIVLAASHALKNFTDTTASLGTSYIYSVTTINGTDSSAAVTIPVSVPTKPVPPTAVTVSAGPQNNQAVINWAYPTEMVNQISGFIVERRAGTTGPFSSVSDNLGNNIRSFSNSNLSQDIDYSYRVRAINGVIISEPSNATPSIRFTPPPPAPVALSFTTSVNRKLNLKWRNDGTGVTGFTVQRKAAGESNFSDLAITPIPTGSTREISDSNVTEGSIYTYRVIAKKGNLFSVPSQELLASVSFPPPAPTNVRATVQGRMVRITWTFSATPTPATGFKILRSDQISSVATEIPNQNISATDSSFIDTTPTGGSYIYNVVALNGTSKSALSRLSNSVSIPFLLRRPLNPQVSVSPGLKNKIQFTDDSNNESSFEIWFSASNSTGNLSLLTVVSRSTDETTQTGGRVTFDHTGLTPRTNYIYRVRAVGRDGTSDFSIQATARQP